MVCPIHGGSGKTGASFVSVHYAVDKNPGPNERFHLGGYQHPDVYVPFWLTVYHVCCSGPFSSDAPGPRKASLSSPEML